MTVITKYESLQQNPKSRWMHKPKPFEMNRAQLDALLAPFRKLCFFNNSTVVQTLETLLIEYNCDFALELILSFAQKSCEWSLCCDFESLKINSLIASFIKKLKNFFLTHYDFAIVIEMLYLAFDNVPNIINIENKDLPIVIVGT